MRIGARTTWPRGAGQHARSRATLAAILASALLGLATAVAADAKSGDAGTAAPEAGRQQLGERYEQIRGLPPAERLAALEALEPSVAGLLRDAPESERAAVRMLLGRIQSDRGAHGAALESFRDASGGRGPFVDDAEFAAIEALEGAGRDVEAMREWAKWEKRNPQSPLMPAARLAQVWNTLRRGETAEARKRAAALVAAHPWLEREPGFALARATCAYLAGEPAEALALLGAKPATASGLYLRALCLARQGARLKAAAAFQEVAERFPGSTLRDHALLAKANTFLEAGDYRSAADEFARVVARVSTEPVRGEAELRHAGAVFLAGQVDSALAMLRALVESRAGSDVAARAQFLVGEATLARGQHAEAIVEFNRVLTTYFQHQVAASAQYRVARSLDALGRRADATGSYQAVVSGYPLEPEAPAAAYLAGVGLLEQGKPLAAAPYFQLVLDRYAARQDERGLVVFGSPEHQELVEAALCLLEYSYHRAGNLGQLSGAPHLLLQRMPPSRSPWRAHALLIDADAAAAMGRYAEAQTTLEDLTRDFPDHVVGASATKLLAWTYARQGRDSLAIATEERLLARYGTSGRTEIVSAAFLDIAHERFNQKRYREAAGAYEDFLRRFPGHPRRPLALYQAGLCYLRLDRAGDAVDRWEAVARDSAAATLAERALARAGDVYFQAERYADAKRCYRGLLEQFAGSPAASLASLRLAQCEYNAGDDAAAIAAFSATLAQYPGTAAAREAQRGQERALYRLSQTAKGATVLAELVEHFPDSPFAADALFQIGKRAYAERRYDAAAEGFRRVVSQFPGFSSADQAQFLMADALALAGKPDEARRAYEQFQSYFPGSALASTVHFRLGLMRFEAKEFMQAAVSFTAALEDSVAKDVATAARYNLALCQRMIGDPAAARAELERYAREFPNDARAAEVAYQLGDLEDGAGETAAAIAHFERALASSPKSGLAIELHYRLGRAREQAGDTKAALASYEAASSFADRDHPFRLSAVARLAALYEARRDVDRAVAAYRDIMRNAKDPELVAAATGRVSQLAGTAKKR